MLRQSFLTISFGIIFLLFHMFPSSTALRFHQFYFQNSTAVEVASSQFHSLAAVPLSFFITRPGYRMSHTTNFFLTILILLSGDIQSNPGPVSNSFLNICTLNIRSLTNPLHYTAIADLANTHNINVFALTETWISPKTTSAEILDSIPHGYTLISTPRPVPASYTSSVIGGGTAFLIKEP